MDEQDIEMVAQRELDRVKVVELSSLNKALQAEVARLRISNKCKVCGIAGGTPGSWVHDHCQEPEGNWVQVDGVLVQDEGE